MSEIEIRQMRKEDIEDVYAIEKESFTDCWARNDYVTFEKENGRLFFVALYQESIVAYCVVTRVVDECEILRIAVKKSCRRLGIAYRLLKEVIDLSQSSKVRFYYLEVRESNVNAKKLYEKLGFLESGRRKDYYRNPAEDAVLMSLVV